MINHSGIASCKSEYKKDSSKIGWKTQRGDIYLRCFWHYEKTPSLVVHPKTKDYYHCYGCGRSGDIRDLKKKLNIPTVEYYNEDQLELDLFDLPF